MNRNIPPLRVEIRVRDSAGEVGIGCVSPPTVNTIPIYHANDEWLGKRSPTGKPVNVHDAINDLWAKWRKEVYKADTDSEFVDWLCGKHGWTYHEPAIIHVIEV